MKLYQKLAIAGAAIAATLMPLSMTRGESNRENSAKPSLERVITAEKPVEITEANKKLRDFPNTFGPYGSVKKYENPNAKYCLTHVKQRHALPKGFHIPSVQEIEEGKTKYKSEGRILSKEEAKDEFRGMYLGINKIQKDIGGVLSHLISNQGLKQVRIEGYMAEEPVSDDFERYYNSEVDRIHDKGYFDDKSSVRWIPGAALKLAVERGLKLMPAEKRKAFDKHIKTGNEEDLYNPRENALLELVSEYGKPFSVATYGANHDFKDNITSWNTKYPTKKFSLIEVTPGKVDYKKK